MKTIYFVRHGQSTGNISSVYQDIDVPLTEEGKKQARFIADRCKKLSVEAIISSTQLRARETAEIIGKKIGHDVEFSDLFRERRKPSALKGKSFNDTDARELNDRWWKSLVDEGPRAEDGENFQDINMRAKNALALLEARKEKHMLVVTHGFYMRYLVAKAIFGEKLTGENFEPFARSFVMENTGITVLRLGAAISEGAWGPSGKWQVWIWNDHAHLG